MPGPRPCHCGVTREWRLFGSALQSTMHSSTAALLTAILLTATHAIHDTAHGHSYHPRHCSPPAMEFGILQAMQTVALMPAV